MHHSNQNALNDGHRDTRSQTVSGLLHVTLDRPGYLNALTLEMIRGVSGYLNRIKDDRSVHAVFIDGSGDRAFCAGGDIKQAYYTGMAYRRGDTAENIANIFFEEEYALNYQIASYTKPIVSYANGIIMGGGYGIAGHGSHIVATEKTRFAMPETLIGFFPDVGSAYYLSRMAKSAGMYIGLTGETISGEDMVALGLADCYLNSKKFDELYAAISDVTKKAGDQSDTATKDKITDTLNGISMDIPEAQLKVSKELDAIDKVFSQTSLKAIYETLEGADDEFSRKTLSALRQRSLLSQAVTFEHINRARNETLDEVLERDLNLARQFLNGHEFYEGIRARLIDKDNDPQWDVKSIEYLDLDEVKGYFT